MTMEVEKLGDLSVIDESKWVEHFTQAKAYKLRKSKCLKSPFEDNNQKITVWRPRSLQNTNIKTPFQRKMTPGQTVINRSNLNPQEHIKLLAVPKRPVYDPHTLKPVRKNLRSCCSPRLVELSVPKRERVYNTWTQYHHKLAPSTLDRLYELLLTLEMPNRSRVVGTNYCAYRVKSAKKKKTRLRQKIINNNNNGQSSECTIKQCATCFAVKMSSWICCQIERKLNKAQNYIADHIKKNLEESGLIGPNYNLREPLKMCAVIVYKILHQVTCYDSYTPDNMLSNSTLNQSNYLKSDDSDGDDDNNKDDDVSKISKKEKISSKKPHSFVRSAPEDITGISITSKISTHKAPKEDIQMNKNITEDNNDINTKSFNSIHPDIIPTPKDHDDKQQFIPTEEKIIVEHKVPRNLINDTLQKSKVKLYPVVPVIEKILSDDGSVSKSTSRVCDFSDELNCLCREIYNNLDIISSDLHNFDTMPHAPNTVCCASIKAWAVFLREVAETAKTWCFWVAKTVNRMRKIASILKDDSKSCYMCKKRKLAYHSYRKWVKFFEKLDCDVGRWRTYNNHVQEISNEIVSHYKNKRVECCELCKEEYYDVTKLSVRHVSKQLMDALNASKYWREWLDEMVDECESLTKLISKDEGSLIKLSMSHCGMKKHKCNFQQFQGSFYSISEINV